MKYYLIKDGNFNGFYDDEIHGDLEGINGFYEISEEKWRELLSGEGEIRYIDEELININPTRAMRIADGTLTIESEKEKARTQREKEFDALDIFDAKIAVERETLTAEEKTEIDTWYATWKEIPNNYTDIKVPIGELYPERPYKVEYYYKGE